MRVHRHQPGIALTFTVKASLLLALAGCSGSPAASNNVQQAAQATPAPSAAAESRPTAQATVTDPSKPVELTAGGSSGLTVTVPPAAMAAFASKAPVNVRVQLLAFSDLSADEQAAVTFATTSSGSTLLTALQVDVTPASSTGTQALRAAELAPPTGSLALSFNLANGVHCTTGNLVMGQLLGDGAEALQGSLTDDRGTPERVSGTVVASFAGGGGHFVFFLVCAPANAGASASPSPSASASSGRPSFLFPVASPTPGASSSPSPSASTSPGASPTPTPAASASTSPGPSATPTPVAGSPVANPTSMAFQAIGDSQQLVVTQGSYPGPFTTSATCSSGNTTIANVSPTSSSGVFNVTSAAVGSCTITVTGNGGLSAGVFVQVSTTSVTIQ